MAGPSRPEPKLSADPTDVSGYRRGAKGRAEGAAGSGARIGINVLVGALVVGLATAGWFIAVQYQQIEKAESALERADHRIAVLEERSQVTDQVMTESGSEVQSKLGQWESEVRKLWDVSKRDRQLITDIQTRLKTQDGVLGGVQTSLKDLSSASARHEQALAQQTAIAQQLASVDQQVRQLVVQQRQLTDQVNAARQSLASLESGLTRRVVSNEKAIDAIDQYRLQLNSRLVDLQTRIDALQAPQSP
jgi:chromosome segregation ATPase